MEPFVQTRGDFKRVKSLWALQQVQTCVSAKEPWGRDKRKKSSCRIRKVLHKLAIFDFEAPPKADWPGQTLLLRNLGGLPLSFRPSPHLPPFCNMNEIQKSLAMDQRASGSAISSKACANWSVHKKSACSFVNRVQPSVETLGSKNEGGCFVVRKSSHEDFLPMTFDSPRAMLRFKRFNRF